jgi:putative hydrolase of the HAD superfamily
VLTYFDLAGAARYLEPLLPLSIDEIIERWLAWQLALPAPVSIDDERAMWDGYWAALADEFALDASRRSRLHRFDYTMTIRAFPDARPALVSLRAFGIRCVVFSNFSLPSIDASLAACGLAELVDHAWVGGAVGALKPSPASWKFVIDALSLPADACIVVDDTPANVEGARAVGMRAYHVDRTRETALDAGRIKDLRALESLVLARSARDADAAG